MLIWRLMQLKSKKAERREKAARKLGQSGSKRAIQPLVSVLEDVNWDVRRAAAKALESLYWQPRNNSEARLYAIASENWDETSILDEAAIQPLLDILSRPLTWDAERSAIETLSKIGSPAVQPLLIALKNPNFVFRNAAAEALGKIGDTQAVQPLISALKSSETIYRDAVVKALGKIGDPQAVQPLLEALRRFRGYSYERIAVVEALGEIGDAQAVQPIVELLVDKLRHVLGSSEGERSMGRRMRRTAARALGKIGDAQAVQPLVEALQDIAPSVRAAVVEALGEIGDARAVQPLVTILAGDDGYAGAESLAYSVSLAKKRGNLTRPAEVTDLVVREVFGYEDEVKEIGGYEYRDGPSANDIRAEAARALGKIGDAQAVQSLVVALKDGFRDVKSAAVVALGDIGDSRSAAPLEEMLKDEDDWIRRLASEALEKIRQS